MKIQIPKYVDKPDEVLKIGSNESENSFSLESWREKNKVKVQKQNVDITSISVTVATKPDIARMDRIMKETS